MATFTNRNGRITAQIRKTKFTGEKYSVSRTFSTIEEAIAWSNSYVPMSERLDRDDKYMLSTLDVLRLQRHPANHAICGVYFLFAGRKCVYVGQSTNIFVRLRDHQMPNSRTSAFDSFSYLEVPKESLNAVEMYYIVLFSPPLNIALNAMSGFVR